MYGLTPQKSEQKEYELVEVIEVLRESVLFKRKGMVLAVPIKYKTDYSIDMRHSEKTKEKARNFLSCLHPSGP